VSVLAGIALMLGGLTHDVAWWMVVPPLVLARIALGALEGRADRF
jgi:hypothetical protein